MPDYPKEAVRAAFATALSGAHTRRAPEHVTADRLKKHYKEKLHLLDPSEQLSFEATIQALEEIGNGDRS